MSFGQVSLLFLLQLSFGGLATLLVGDRQALGPKYAKVSGWILVALLGLGVSLCGAALFDDSAPPERLALAWSTIAATVAILASTSLSGWDLPGFETATLVIALLASGAAVGLSAHQGALLAGGGSPGLAIAGAYGSALVLGFVTWGMVLGHWYLVAPGLPISHLARLTSPLPWILIAKTLVSAAALALGWEVLLAGEGSLGDLLARRPERVIDVVNMSARIPVGLLVPVVLAFMTRVVVRMEKTQPATGILYAMCALVYLGDLMGKMIEGATGVAL